MKKWKELSKRRAYGIRYREPKLKSNKEKI